jgi:hypothetical protein
MSLKEVFAIGIGGYIAGFLLYLGIPDIGELILIDWGLVSGFLIYILTPDQHIFVTIAGIFIILIGLYFIVIPLIEAIKFGIEGIIIFIVGFLLGVGTAAYLISVVKSILGF